MSLFDRIKGKVQSHPTAKDDFKNLRESEHILKWLADKPFVAIRSSVENILQKQAADSRLVALRVSSMPQWLTGARPTTNGGNDAIITRAAVAFEVELSVESEQHLRRLSGVFTWAGVHLDEPSKRAQRVWLDFDGTLEEQPTRLPILRGESPLSVNCPDLDG